MKMRLRTFKFDDVDTKLIFALFRNLLYKLYAQQEGSCAQLLKWNTIKNIHNSHIKNIRWSTTRMSQDLWQSIQSNPENAGTVMLI